jgi:methyl-accepting chemotaxis protein
MQREAAELAEQGHKEEATNLKRKAMAMLEEAERLQHGQLEQRHPEIMKLKQWPEKLRQEEKRLTDEPGAGERLADVRREAKQVEAKLRAISQGPNREPRGPDEDIARRLEHMRIAGLHDVAEHVAQRAEAAERELHEHRQGQGGDVMHEIMKQLDELRHEVGRLRDEVNELREKR